MYVKNINKEKKDGNIFIHTNFEILTISTTHTQLDN